MTCSPDPGTLIPADWYGDEDDGNILEFECNNASGDQIEVTEVSGSNSLTLQNVAIFGQPVTGSCNAFELCDPIVIPEQIAQVGEEPVTYTFSSSTICGLASFNFTETYDWLKIEADTDLQTTTFTIEPLANSASGAKTLTLQMSLIDYPDIELEDIVV